MKTIIRPGGTPLGRDAAWISVYPGDGMRTTGHEISFRRERLAAEADRERLAGPREGLRQWIGHAVMAVGRAIHGLEPEPQAPARSVLHAR